MTRPLYLHEGVQKATTLALLTTILIVATARSIVVHRQRLHHLHFPGRSTPDTALFVSGVFRPSAFRATEPDAAPPTPGGISPAQRVRFVVRRLAGYSGAGRGFARVAHVVVSLVGILGMFSAIVGALLGPWLADTADDSLDDERFSYWVCDAEDEEDERTCGYAREEKYAPLRLFEVP